MTHHLIASAVLAALLVGRCGAASPPTPTSPAPALRSDPDEKPSFGDAAYVASGATVVSSEDIYDVAGVLTKIRPPTLQDMGGCLDGRVRQTHEDGDEASDGELVHEREAVAEAIAEAGGAFRARVVLGASDPRPRLEGLALGLGLGPVGVGVRVDSFGRSMVDNNMDANKYNPNVAEQFSTAGRNVVSIDQKEGKLHKCDGTNIDEIYDVAVDGFLLWGSLETNRPSIALSEATAKRRRIGSECAWLLVISFAIAALVSNGHHSEGPTHPTRNYAPRAPPATSARIWYMMLLVLPLSLPHSVQGLRVGRPDDNGGAGQQPSFWNLWQGSGQDSTAAVGASTPTLEPTPNPTPTQRRLHSCPSSQQAVRLDYSLRCGHTRHTADQGCNKNACVEGVPVYFSNQSGNPAKILYNSNQTPRNSGNEFYWHCDGHRNNFRPSEADEFNMVESYRRGNERGIWFRFKLCKRVGPISIPDSHHEVILRKDDGTHFTLEKANGIGAGGGTSFTSERLGTTMPAVSNLPDDKKYYLEIIDSTKFKLRAKPSADRSLDVCVQANVAQQNYCDEVDAADGSEDGTFGTLPDQFWIYPLETPFLPLVIPNPQPLEVYLLTVGAGAMRTLHLQPHAIYGHNGAAANQIGQLGFEPFDASRTFRLDQQEEGFRLTPSGSYRQRVNACLEASTPVTITSCLSEGSGQGSILWKTDNGRIVASRDASSCLNIDPNTFDARNGPCTSDAKSFVAIIPKKGSGSGGTHGKTFDQIPGVFPKSGFHLLGGTNMSGEGRYFSQVKVRPDSTNGSVSITENTALEFTFVLDGPEGTRHSVCLHLLNDGILCANLAGSEILASSRTKTVNLDTAIEGRENLYLIDLEEEFGATTTIVSKRVNYLIFEQTGEASTRSRFYNIAFFEKAGARLSDSGRRYNELTMDLTIRSGLPSLQGLHFQPHITMQDIDGPYRNRVTAAEASLIPLDLSNNQVTIENLSPGRRYNVRLDPVNSSGQRYDNDLRTVKAAFIQWTSCSCVTTEYTGRPAQFIVTQEKGLMKTAFIDKSVCEEAFSFTRQLIRNGQNDVEGESEKAYAPSFYISTKKCTDEAVIPGKDFLDEVSGLVVGNTYQYRVAAVASQYMVNQAPSNELDGSMDDRSEDVFYDVTVKWESSATIEVSLTAEAGSLPVEGTTLQWDLIRCPGSCTTMDSASSGQITTLDDGEELTPSNGKVHIEFYVDPNLNPLDPLDATSQLGLRIRPTKTAEDGTPHTYKCNNEAHTCPLTGFVTNLAHLETTIVQFADATLIPMQGTVYMGESTEATRCPLPGVRVCPHRVEGSVALGPEEDALAGECVDTGRDGTYSINVVLNTRVYPAVSLSGHDFKPHALNSKTNRYDTGIEASFAALAAGYFHGHDFFDSTVTTLDVIVAGGACNHRLGTATVQVTFQECSSDLWSQTEYQITVKGSWEVPAQKVNVKITALQEREADDRDFIMVQYLNNEVKRLDLSNIQPAAASGEQPLAAGPGGGTSSPTTSPTSSPTTAPTRRADLFVGSTGEVTRFQYNGVLNIDPKIESPLDLAAGTKCASYERDGSVFHTKSFHVLKTGAEFDLIMYLNQLILPDESPPVYCGIVDDSTEINVENKVGIDPSEGASSIDKNALLKLRRSGIDTKRYTRCVQTCTVSPEPAVVPGGGFTDTRTTAVLELQAGIPELAFSDSADHPYSKQITLTSGDTRHVLHVVVIGDYSDDDSGDSFPLPTYEPLMIIRDPPGGESSVTYTNVQTTMKVSMEQYERYDGWDSGLHLGHVSDSETETTISTGIIPGPQFITGMLKISESYMLGKDDDMQYLKQNKDAENSVELSFIWSYSTSGSTGQGYAGKQSDVFLVPTMLVMYRETQTINFDLETCTATKPPNIVKFDLASQDNKQPFSFLSYYLVMLEILPELEKNLESDLFYRETATGADLLRIEKQLSVTRASLDGWYSILAKYEETNNKAYYGEGLNSAGKWFVQTKEVRPTCSMRSFDEGNDGYQYRCTTDEDNNPTTPLISGVCENFAQNECTEEDAEYDKLYTESQKPDSDYTVGVWEEISETHEYWEYWEFENPQIDKDLVSLAPPKLLDGANRLATTNTLLEQQRVDLAPLKSTGTIHFSGGGSILSLEFDRAKMDQIANLWSNPNLVPDANTDDHKSVGFDTDGAVLFTGLGIGWQGHRHVTDFISHRMNTGTEQSSSTNIRVELGDPDAEDEFVVDMYLDDVYGTFVFATRDGSRSKCPNENNTKAIEDPFIDISARPGVTPTDELMVFDVRIENKGWGESTFFLLSDKLENSGGLSIEIDGANLNMFTPWRLKGTNYGGTFSQSTLTIKKGPQLDVFDAVDIYLQSRCEFNEEYGSAKNSAPLYNKVVEKPPPAAGTTASPSASPQADSTPAPTVSQYDYYIEFTPPCLAVEWSGTLLREGRFKVNSSSSASVVVSIFNPLYLNKKMVEIVRFPLDVDPPGKIMLEYRKVSGEYQDWIPGVDDETGGEINFLTAPEDSFGVATVQWRAPAYDATFEIRLRCVCLPHLLTAPQKINSYTSTSMFGIVDRRPPSVFGLPVPQTNLHPGQELKVEFDEDVDCEKEFMFNVKMTIEGYQDPFASNSGALAVICVENFITIQLVESSQISYNVVLGRNFTLTILDVTDIVGNVLESFEYTSNFVCDPPQPRLTITHPAGPSRKYLPHDAMIFEAVIANDNDAFAWSTSVLELGVDLSTNLDDFQVMGNGQSLTSNQLYTLDGGASLTTEIAVLKGPGSQLQFPPLTLFLRSNCVQDGHDPVEVTAQAYNFENGNGGQFIQFTAPCPPIRWAGNFNDVKTLMLSENALTSINSMLKVSIFNEGYADRRYADNPRLEDVSLFYRRVGEWGPATVEDWQSSQWTNGMLKDSQARETDFSGPNIEDILGFATLFWDLTTVDESAYEVRVVSRCQPILDGSVSELDSYSTEMVQVVIDKTPPRAYGAPELSLPSGLYPYHDTIQRPNHFHPSHEYVISFTEALRCDQPYVFGLSVTVGAGADPYDSLHVICEGSDIKFKFDYDYEDDGAGPESLVNKDVTVTLSGVQDLAGNVAEDYVKTYHQCDTDISRGTRQYRGMGCDGLDNDCDLLVDECDEDMIPPVLSFKEGLSIDSSEQLLDGTIVINSPTFDSLEKGRKYLENVLKAEDDCAVALNLEVASPPVARCADTKYTVTVHDTRCPDHLPQIIEQIYALKVDTTPPVVNIVLERGAPISNRVYFDPNGKYLHIDEDTFDFEDIEFSYTVEDGCHQHAQVEVTVLSNEFEYAHSKTSMNMVLIEEKEFPVGDDRRQSHRLSIFVEVNACQREGHQGFLHSKPLCKWDDNTSPFRFYNVRVTATNYVDLVGTETVTVIILENDYDTKLRRYGPRYDNDKFFIEFANSTPPSRVITSKRLEWDTSISSAQLASPLQNSIQSTATVEESTEFITTFTSTLNIGGFDVTADQAVMVETLTEAISETLTSTLEPGQEIESVVIVSIGGIAVEEALRRRLEDARTVEYRATVLACTVNCTQDVGVSMLQQMQKALDVQVESQNFTTILQKVAEENGFGGMQDVTLLGAEISDEMTIVEESHVNVALSSKMTLQMMDMTRVGENAKLVFVALETTLQRIGCSAVDARSCMVKLIRFNGAPVDGIQSRRQLQTLSAPEFEFEVMLDVVCNGSVNCADATALANLLNEQVTRAIEESIQQGELVDSLWALLLPYNVAQDVIRTTSLTQGLPNNTTQQPAGFYPDFEGVSVRCLSSENAPAYTNGDATWFYPTLEECCLTSFPDFPKVCSGSSVGFYPDWQSQKIACSNDDEKIPRYILNSASFQHETLQECCTIHFQWDTEACIIQSGGKVATVAENEWYVNWEKKICQQNCLKETGSNQYGDQGLNCGGLVPMGEQLFQSALECCSTKLSWLSLSVCLDESKPPPTAVTGTTRWYVSHLLEMCVQDCSSEFNAVAGIVHCGGVVRDASVTLYDSPDDCCSEHLGWIPKETCVAESIELHTGWLEELLDNLGV